VKARKNLRESFITGSIILAPFFLTLVIFRIVFGWTRNIVSPILENEFIISYLGEYQIVASIVAVVLIPTVIVLVGLMARSQLGRKTLGEGGKAISLVPLFRTVYFSIKNVANSMTHSSRYKRVVAVEYPRKGIYSLGFVTADTPESFGLGEDLVNLFLPNSPNPTGGRFIIAKEGELEELDITVKEGLKMVMTAGLHEDEELPESIR